MMTLAESVLSRKNLQILEEQIIICRRLFDRAMQEFKRSTQTSDIHPIRDVTIHQRHMLSKKNLALFPSFKAEDEKND